MKTLKDAMVETLDYISFHLPEVGTVLDSENSCITVVAENQNLDVYVDFDGIFDSYRLAVGFSEEQSYSTLVDLCLAIALATGATLRYGRSACDDVATITPPLQNFPFRVVTYKGKRRETHLYFDPDIQLAQVPRMDIFECSQAILFNQQYPLNPRVLTSLQARRASLLLINPNNPNNPKLPPARTNNSYRSLK